MTRINIEISEELHKRLKVAAALKEEALKRLIVEILEKKAEEEVRRNKFKI